MTCGRPPAKNSARRFSRPPSRPYGYPSLSSKGIGLSGPKGQPNGSPLGFWGLRGSLESSLRLPKLAQRADGHEMESDFVRLTY